MTKPALSCSTKESAVRTPECLIVIIDRVQHELGGQGASRGAGSSFIGTAVRKTSTFPELYRTIKNTIWFREQSHSLTHAVCSTDNGAQYP